MQTPYSTCQQEAEGGCGVVGLAASAPVARIVTFFEPLQQMHNRGNGKGGGIAAVGLDPEQMGVRPARCWTATTWSRWHT